MHNSITTIKDMKTIKAKDILDKKFSILASVNGNVINGTNKYEQHTLTLQQIFELCDQYIEPVNILRNMTYHSDEQRMFKSKFPCWIVGGVCEYGNVSDNAITEYSNIITLDIDSKDNEHLDLQSLRSTLFSLPYVFSILESISGKGYYIIIPVEDGRYTKEYYSYLVKLFKQKYDINIDKQCGNIARKRFISYDSNQSKWIKQNDIDIWSLKLVEKHKQQTEQHTFVTSKYKQNNSEDMLHKTIKYLVDNGFSIDYFNGSKYNVWYYVACDFSCFDDGLDLFIRFSNNSSSYRDTYNSIVKKFNEAKKISNIDDLCRKYYGIAKKLYGNKWYERINS